MKKERNDTLSSKRQFGPYAMSLLYAASLERCPLKDDSCVKISLADLGS